jgi:hypothetical protein
VVNHGRERGRLARTSGASHEHEAALLFTYLLEHRREQQLADRQDACRNQAQDEANRTALLEDVAAETTQPRHRVRDIDLKELLELLLLLAGHHRERHCDGVFLHQPLELDKGHERAVDSDQRMGADLEVNVRRLALGCDFENVVNMHRGFPSRRDTCRNPCICLSPEGELGPSLVSHKPSAPASATPILRALRRPSLSTDLERASSTSMRFFFTSSASESFMVRMPRRFEVWMTVGS